MEFLSIENLSINFDLPDKTVKAVRNLSLSVKKGETLGIVGESGCGKTVTAYSILSLIGKPGRIASGKITYKGNEISSYGEKELQKIRGKEISMIFQEPMTSLNPVFKIGYQISESIRLHLKKSKKEAKEYAIDLLRQVGIPDPDKRYDSYPHELSGGMRQRVMIAIALSASPSLLIADEPTTALDVTIQAQILDLLLNIQKKNDMSLIMISHDLGVVANVADRVAIMYAGEIVEMGNVKDIFENPLHPYTKGLFESIPQIGKKSKKLYTIKGSVPTITEDPMECVFYPRCSQGDGECTKGKIDLCKSLKEESHLVRCIKAQ